MSSPDDTTSDDKRAAYQQWAQRLRADKEALRSDAAGPAPSPAASNPMWSTEALFRGDALLDLDEETRRHVGELFATLGLPPDATLDQAREAHASLTIEVHPEANTDATARTQVRNIGRLIEINAAFKELEEILGPR